MHIFRQSVYTFGLIFTVLSLASSTEAQAQIPIQPPVVIELFTSQGCSSCPPADRLIGELSKQPGVITMSLPVTYWDYLGWKDTLAKAAFSERQRHYASHIDGQVYTPQAVINGVKGCVGSSRSQIEAAIAGNRETLRKAAVPVSIERKDGTLVIHASPAPKGSAISSGAVWVASITHSAAVSIGSGENGGHKITYTNVVRTLANAGRWTGQDQVYTVSLKDAGLEGGDMYIAFLQGDDLGPIVGAAQWNG